MSLATKLARFGLVTVMKPKFYTENKAQLLFELDTLRISNITQEGPTKTAKGGLSANTVLRYGKTMRIEMEDVIGRIDVLQYLMGAKVTDGVGTDTSVESFTAVAGQSEFIVLKTPTSVTTVKQNGTPLSLTDDYTVSGSVITLIAAAEANDIIVVTYTHAEVETVMITDKFSPVHYIEGTTYVIDENGEKQWITITIPRFLSDSIFNMTMEAEGDFGVMAIAGEIQANECGEFYFFGDETNHTC